MNLLDPNEFVSAILPDGLWSNDSGAEDSEECLVCILCNVDFDKDVNLDECLHWIPGWFSKDLPHAQELSNQWLSDFEDLENKELVDLNEKKDYALEEVVANALEFDIARCERACPITRTWSRPCRQTMESFATTPARMATAPLICFGIC